MAKYNAVYGGFAALPLFLVWLQFSWLVVLFGAEISFAIDNDERYEFERDCLNVSLRFKRLLALRIVELAAKRFAQGEQPLSAMMISHELEAPIRFAREVPYELIGANVLAEVKCDGDSAALYQSGQHVDRLTIKCILDVLDKRGHPYVRRQTTRS